MSRSFPVAVSLNLISMSGSAFALLVSTIMLGLLIKSLIHKFDVGILLYANIYIGIFGFSLFSLMNNVDMYKGDYGLFVGEETLSCHIRGYMLYVFGCYARYVLALQGVFRLCCLIYPSKIWLQKSLTYIVALLIVCILCFLLILPLYIWVDIKLISEETICLVTATSARGLIWNTISIYVLPMVVISNVYLNMTRYLRQAPLIVSTHSKRDIIAIRRLVLILIILFVMGAPITILMLTLPFTKLGEPLFYRIGCMTMTVSISTLTLMLIYTSPQLKHIITQLIKKNQVAPLHIRNGNKRIAALAKT